MATAPGAVTCITKPFRLAALVAAIEAAFPKLGPQAKSEGRIDGEGQ